MGTQFFEKERPGSMAEADRKANLVFVGVALIIYILITLCFTSFDFYTHYAYLRAPGWANALGIIFIWVSFVLVFLSQAAILPSQSGWVYWAFVLIILGIGCGTAGGWNFSLSGMPNIQ